MRKTEAVERTVTVQQLNGMVCNFCGKEGQYPYGEYMECDVVWGFGSVRDMSGISFDVCDECVYNVLVPMMKVPPTHLDE